MAPQYSCLENPTEEPGGLQPTVHRITKSRTQLNTRTQVLKTADSPAFNHRLASCL